MSFEERKTINRNYRKVQQELEKNEKAISEMEEKLEALKNKMNSPETASDPDVFSDYAKAEKRLDELMYEWELINERLEEAERQKKQLDG